MFYSMRIQDSANPQLNEVERAVSGVRDELVGLASLMQMGEFACGPLAVAISRAPDPAHRMYILALLRAIGSAADSDVVDVLMRLAKKDPSELIRGMAAVIFSDLMDRQLARKIGAASESRRREDSAGTAEAAVG